MESSQGATSISQPAPVSDGLSRTVAEFICRYRVDRPLISFKDGLPISKVKQNKAKTVVLRYGSSASSWNTDALLAIRVVPIRGLHPSRIIPCYNNLLVSVDVSGSYTQNKPLMYALKFDST